MTKSHSPSFERNKDPILQVLKSIIKKDRKKLLEIGSGTGQHAVYFAPHWPDLQWVTSDRLGQHEAIQSWLKEAALKNLVGPLRMEIGKDRIPKGEFDLLFLANVLHIISWDKVRLLLEMIGESFNSGAEIIFYGPFNYDGQFTSTSNEKFDAWLKERDQQSGIRNFEDICDLFKKENIGMVQDYEMPANNRLLHFKKE